MPRRGAWGHCRIPGRIAVGTKERACAAVLRRGPVPALRFSLKKCGVGVCGGGWEGAGGKHGAAAAVTSSRGVASVPARLPWGELPPGVASSKAGRSPSPRLGAARTAARRLPGPAAATFVCPRPARPPPAPGTFPLGGGRAGGRARAGHVTAALPAAALTSPPTSAGAAAPPPRTKERPLRHEQRRDGQVQHLSRRG